MTTNANLSEDGELFKRGQELIIAAKNYWDEYRKQFRPSAVVWLETDNGALIVFTRSEYKRSLMEAVEDIGDKPLPEHFFGKL